MQLRFLFIISILFLSGSLIAQNWRKSSFDLSISNIAIGKEIDQQRINEFLNNVNSDNKFNYQEAKKVNVNHLKSNYPSITFINLNYVLKRNTNILFFKHILFTSGLNFNISDGANYAFSINDTSTNYRNFIEGDLRVRKKGLGINIGFSLLSKPFLKSVKFQSQIFNSFSPFSIIKYSSSIFNASQNIYGTYYYFYGNPLKNSSNYEGKLMNNTQIKLGVRFNVDCTGNIFINYVANYTIYKGKPDINFKGFSQGIEFGMNFLLTNDGESLDTPNAFW